MSISIVRCTRRVHTRSQDTSGPPEYKISPAARLQIPALYYVVQFTFFLKKYWFGERPQRKTTEKNVIHVQRVSWDDRTTNIFSYQKILQKIFVNVAMHLFSNNRKDPMIKNETNVRHRQDIKIVH